MIVLDTNVISELMRPRPQTVVTDWLESRSRLPFAVTAITMAEIFYGIELLPGGKRKRHLLAEAEAMFKEDYRTVLAFDDQAARVFSVISATRRADGKPISPQDAQIAAIVQVHGAILATRNEKDFQNCGIPILNPWNPQ